MPAQIPIQKIVSSTLEGIVQAQRSYVKWTAGDWLWNAPEYLLTTFIADKISRIDGAKYITLENSAKGALDDAGAIGRGKLNSKIRASGRFDVVLWWGNYTPRAIIEVKNQISQLGHIKADLQRISQVLKLKNDVSSFQFGLMAFYTSASDGKNFSAKEILKKRIENMYAEANYLLGNKFDVSIHKKSIRTDEDSAWIAATLLIKYRGE